MLGYWSRDLHLLNKVVVCSKHFILIRKMHYFTEKKLKITNRHSAQKVHCMKVCKYGDFFGPYFPVLGLNTEIYGVNLRIQYDYRKIRKKKIRFLTLFPYLDPFHVVVNKKWYRKWIKKGAKSSYILQILMSVKARFCCFISLLFDYQ